MTEKITKKKQILEALESKALTSSEIAEITNVDINHVYVYLNRMLNKEVVRITDKKPYKYEMKNDTYRNNLNNRILHDKIDKLEKNNAELKEGYKQFNSLFKALMENTSNLLKTSKITDLKQLISDNIDINLIKKINMEMNLK